MIADGSVGGPNLLTIVAGTNVTTTNDVIVTLEAIDAALPASDGLKWFNLLYLMVTKRVDGAPPAGGWANAAWLNRLDVVFAHLYFTAIKGWLQNDPSVPNSWKPLCRERFTPGIDRIQFALAGMNAHINHDLALALLQTNAEFNLIPSLKSREHGDFEHVNVILEAVLPEALTILATGILGQVAQDTGKIGRLLAIWSIRAARDLGWEFAGTLRQLRGPFRQAALVTHDQMVGLVSRSLLG
jgi:hypothetical protein